VAQFGDEGAANHTRFCREYGEAGVEFFVFGRSAFDTRYPAPQKYPARQTLEASQAVARLHGLSDDGVVYAQQNPAVIDQGVFHNDVIAVGNGEVLFYHEDAFLETEQCWPSCRQAGQGRWQLPVDLRAAFRGHRGGRGAFLPVQQPAAVPRRRFHAADRAGRVPQQRACLAIPAGLTSSGGLIREVKVFDLKQSMQNGGGPACLRLRVALNETELAAVNPGVIMTARCTTR
jgi:succinylarginine dihydrolase